MSLNESSATALVRLTGLAITCHNKNLNRGEIAFLRDDNHDLCITVETPVYQGGGNDVIGYKPLATYENLPKKDVQIEIKSRGPSTINGYEVYTPGTFDRLNSPDINDFRWIPKLSEFHPHTRVNPVAPYPISKVYLEDALLYTHKVNPDVVFEKVEKGQNGAPEKRELFGSVGETIGAMLQGDEVTFTIRFDGKEETHVLPRIEGLPHRVTMKNMNNKDNVVYSDMADYYGFLSSSDGTQIDFKRLVEDDARAASGDSVNQIEFCHPIGDDDLDSIDDLPQG